MFQKDLSDAQALEDRLAEIFRNNYPTQSVMTSSSLVGIDVSFPDWDLKVIFDDGVEWLIELKQDKQAAKTGNIAVEFGRVINREWRNSCLSLTATTHWVQYFNDTWYCIETKTLRKMAKNKEYSRIASGGAGGNSRFYLFPVELFKSKAIVINDG